MPDVYVSQIDFGDGILRSFKGEGGGGITDFVDVPTLEENEIDYDGTQKEIVFENLDTDKVTVSGTISATEIGTYTCTLTLKSESYYWKDLTNEPKTISWSIIASMFGVEWDGTATTTWTRTDSATNFTDPVPYYSGMSETPSSPFDDIMPWSGMTIEERTGGTMVKIPKFWYKLSQSENKLKVQISNKVKDGFSVSPAHMDRGDGKGERDVVYVSRYHIDTSSILSKTSVNPRTYETRSTARSNCHSKGDTLWLMDFATRFTIWLLYLVEYADWNSQNKIGYGGSEFSTAQNMGYTDSMPYHTGTTLTNRTTFGLGTQYRYIEGLWDNVLDWIDGCYNNSSGFNIILNPSSFSDSSGGVLVGKPSNGFPSAFSVVNIDGAFPLFIPTAANGSNSTYMCDDWGYYYSEPCISVGGSNGNGTLSWGLFFINYSATSYRGYGFGYRSMELP